MKRSQILAAGAAAALILLVLTLRQVSALREEVDGLRDRLLQMEQSLTDQINGIDNAVRRELETQGSLFSASDTTLDYRDGALVLTASVLPKEVRADETLTLSAGGVSAPMAAAVAAATVGLAGLEHMPKVGTLLTGAPSWMVAASILQMNTVCWLVTVRTAGAAPKLQVQVAVWITGFAMLRSSQSWMV